MAHINIYILGFQYWDGKALRISIAQDHGRSNSLVNKSRAELRNWICCSGSVTHQEASRAECLPNDKETTIPTIIRTSK